MTLPHRYELGRRCDRAGGKQSTRTRPPSCAVLTGKHGTWGPWLVLAEDAAQV